MPERISLNGIDISGPLSALPSRGNHGQAFYEETYRRQLIWNSDVKFWMPTLHGIVSSASPILVSDDFKGPSLDAGYSRGSGNDNVVSAFAISSADPLGVLAGTTGDAGSGIAADGIAISGPKVFSTGTERRFKTKLKLSAITNVFLFVGFTDTLPSTTLEQPLSLSGTTYTATATDACGLLFDTSASTDTIRAVGVANGTEATHVDTSLAYVADTYKTLEIVLSADYVMKAYIDGVLAATVTAAARASVDLCPIIVGNARTTASRTVTVDYFCAK